MRNSYTAFYCGISATQGDYGKKFCIHLRDIFCETGEGEYFYGVFGGKSKKLERLKPKFGELIHFFAEIDEKEMPVKFIRPTKISIQLFNTDYEKIFKHFYKNFDEAKSKEEEFVAKRLWRRFPDEEFWRTMNLGFKLNTLNFFLGRDNFEKTSKAYRNFCRRKVGRELTDIKEHVLQKESVAEPLGLDFSRIKQPLINKFKDAKKESN